VRQWVELELELEVCGIVTRERDGNRSMGKDGSHRGARSQAGRLAPCASCAAVGVELRGNFWIYDFSCGGSGVEGCGAASAVWVCEAQGRYTLIAGSATGMSRRNETRASM
jgi:hypothetical protein